MRAASFAVMLFALAQASSVAAAPAEDVAAAQKLFDEALLLMDQKRYVEACPKLERSQRLDPGMGTLYRLAECFEASGLTGTAWRLYREVTLDARIAGRTDRAQQVEARASAIESKVPWLVIELPPAVASLEGLTVKCDDDVLKKEELGKRRPVDPGAHTITVTAKGRLPFSQTVRSLAGSTLRLPIPQLQARADAVEAGMGGQRVAALTTGSFGLALVGMGVGMGVLASSLWDGALKGCEGGATDRCSDEAIADGERANAFSIVSTTGFVAGGAAIAAAPILWFTAAEDPAPSMAIAPSLGPTHFALSLVGRFR